ncbi:MAG: carbonic anhydrase [Candidatus Woykebacteria bacterium]
MKISHKAKALVISCIDFRFVSKVRDFLVEKGLKNSYDLITVPGASLALDSIAANILTSLELHDPDEIHIFDHEECGAYGKSNSKKAHVGNLKRAQQILSQGSPGKKIKTYIAGFENIEEIN